MCANVFLAGFGAVWEVQAEPFHTTATGTTFGLLLYSPTASQNFRDVQDTPCRFPEAAGSGIVCAAQADPSQTNVELTPTASQKLAEEHDTEFTVAVAADDGTVCVCHELPFHCSAIVTPEFPPLTPVHATQNVGEVHETVLNCWKSKSLGSGFTADCRLQEVPFQLAANESLTPVSSSRYPPTASQKRAEVHDTPNSCQPSASTGTGNDSDVHCCPFQESAMPDWLNPD